MPSSRFDYSIDYSKLDLRAQPELYRTGVGDQGVLLVEPYKSELLPHWRFKTPAIAKASAAKIYRLFLAYLKQGDFVGMDMARKFLQMGFTRSRRYANHKSGKKYQGPVPDHLKGRSGSHGRATLPDEPDHDKAKSAEFFLQKLEKVRNNKIYSAYLLKHKQQIQAS